MYLIEVLFLYLITGPCLYLVKGPCLYLITPPVVYSQMQVRHEATRKIDTFLELDETYFMRSYLKEVFRGYLKDIRPEW